MNLKNIISRIFCTILVLSTVFCASACSSTKKDTPVPTDGYELPYQYNDDYTAKLKTIDNTSYLVTSTDLLGNKVIQFTTKQSEEEVNAFYDEYFASLQKVKRTDGSDHTIGYFDTEKRLIMYNLIVWTADGETNYKMGCEACEKLSDSKNWKVIESDSENIADVTTVKEPTGEPFEE